MELVQPLSFPLWELYPFLKLFFMEEHGLYVHNVKDMSTCPWLLACRLFPQAQVHKHKVRSSQINFIC